MYRKIHENHLCEINFKKKLITKNVMYGKIYENHICRNRWEWSPLNKIICNCLPIHCVVKNVCRLQKWVSRRLNKIMPLFD